MYARFFLNCCTVQLKVGNRIVSVNGESMTGKTGSDVCTCTRTLSSTTDYALQALKLRLDYRYNRAHTSHSVCLLCIWTYVCLRHLHVYLPTRTARIHIHIHIRIPCNNACARTYLFYVRKIIDDSSTFFFGSTREH